MGRRKIAIRPILDERNRSVTFIKRKAGLFKKAHELAVLCQVDIALVIIGANGRVFEYTTSTVDHVMSQYSRDLVHESRSPRDYTDLSGDAGIGKHAASLSDSESDYDEPPPPRRGRRTPGTSSATLVKPNSSGAAAAAAVAAAPTATQNGPSHHHQHHQLPLSTARRPQATPQGQVPGPDQPLAPTVPRLPQAPQMLQGHMPPPRAGQQMNPYYNMDAFAMNRAAISPRPPSSQGGPDQQTSENSEPSSRSPEFERGDDYQRPKLKVQIPNTSAEPSPPEAGAPQTVSPVTKQTGSQTPLTRGAQSTVPAHSQAQAQMQLQMQGRGTPGGRWSAGFPQSPMGYLVSAGADSAVHPHPVMPMAGHPPQSVNGGIPQHFAAAQVAALQAQQMGQGMGQQQQGTESTPISAALPSRYMTDMLTSPSNFLSMEWNVPMWDGPQSAGPQSAGPIGNGQRHMPMQMPGATPGGPIPNQPIPSQPDACAPHGNVNTGIDPSGRAEMNSPSIFAPGAAHRKRVSTLSGAPDAKKMA